MQMASRQNKKRKGRNNGMNRERTVTTLTEGPDSVFQMAGMQSAGRLTDEPLSATSSSATAIMSSPFASSSGPNISPGFQIPPTFTSFSNPYSTYMVPSYPQQQSPQFFQPQQQQQQQSMPLPQGQNDLEVLERLKETIKKNQHELYRPIPQPAALASVYLGPHSSTRVPPHSDQLPGGQQSLSGNDRNLSSSSPMMVDGSSTVPVPATGTNGSHSTTGDRRGTRSQDSWENGRRPSGGTSQVSGSNPFNPTPHVVLPSLRVAVIQDPTPTNSGPLVVFVQTSSQAPTVAPTRYEPGSVPSSTNKSSKDKPMDVDDSGPPGLGKQHLPPPSTASASAQRGQLTDTRQGDYAKHDYAASRSEKTGAGESTSSTANRLAGADNNTKGDTRSTRDRDWIHRNSNASSTMGDVGRSPGPGNSRGPPTTSPAAVPPPDSRYADNSNDTRGSGPRDPRYYDKDTRDARDRERERERDSAKTFDSPGRTWDRDRDRDRDRFDRRPADIGGGTSTIGGRLNRDYDRDRRNDDRFRPDARRPPPDQRHYEPRYTSSSSSGGAGEAGLRRYDSKSSVGGNDAPSGSLNSNNVTFVSKADERDRDRVGPLPPSDSRGVSRPLGRDRSFDSSRSSILDDRRTLPPSDDRRPPPAALVDDRRGVPVVDRDRASRAPDDRRPVPPPPTRPPPPANERDHRTLETPPGGSGSVDRQVRPTSDDRRPGPPPRPSTPSTAGDRPSRTGPSQDRRPPPLSSRSVDDRRPSVSSGPPPSTRGPLPPVSGAADDRRPPGPPSIVDDSRRPLPPLSGQDRDATPRASAISLPPTLDQPPTRPADRERSKIHPQIPLEDRLSRLPSLQERLNGTRAEQAAATAPDDRSARSSTLGERPATITGPPPAREQARAPITLTQVDSRPIAPVSVPPEATIRQPPDARVAATVNKANILAAEPIRSAPPPQPSGVPDRGRPSLVDRFSTRPVTPPATSTSGPPSRASIGSYAPGPPSSRANSIVREDLPASFKGHPSTNVSPSRKAEYRPGIRQPQIYERDRRPDAMDVDTPPSARFPPGGGGDRGPPPPPPPNAASSYRRPPTPPYTRPERSAWVQPPVDSYPSDGPRVHAPDSRTYEREWRDDERGVSSYTNEDWERRWDRERDRDRERERERERERVPPPPTSSRDYNRDARFVEREPIPPPAWETREERERRVSYGTTDPPPPPPTSRPYESRPALSARLTDGYPDERSRERDRSRERTLVGRDNRDFDPVRYPPPGSVPSHPPPPPTFPSRVRPRSPSPPASSRRGPPPPPGEDLRGPPPLKRTREDSYPSAYYPSEPDYAHPSSRLRTPPPASTGGGYYDDSRGGYIVSPGHGLRDGRDRDYGDSRDGYGSYDRRPADPASRMPPPRSPPYPRAPPTYGRDDRRYLPPPPRS